MHMCSLNYEGMLCLEYMAWILCGTAVWWSVVACVCHACRVLWPSSSCVMRNSCSEDKEVNGAAGPGQGLGKPQVNKHASACL